MACADEIHFKTAREAEEIFQALTQSHDVNEHYMLVILVTSLHHYITSCFDEVGLFMYMQSLLVILRS